MLGIPLADLAAFILFCTLRLGYGPGALLGAAQTMPPTDARRD